MGRRLEALWYAPNRLTAALVPLSLLFEGVARSRRWLYRQGYLKSERLPVPVVVVGNLSVGGTGKTPLVIWLCEFLQRHGYRPGILASGYGGRARHWPQQVRVDSDPVMVGDEAVVLARHCGVPIAAGRDRVDAARSLLAHHDCDILLSDDGLQHYRLARDIEIAVVDGSRRFGNGRCLPAGPLREPLARLDTVDLIVASGRAARGEHGMGFVPLALRNLRRPRERMGLDSLRRRSVHAVAGLGNPERFFQTLREHELVLIEHRFPDHHHYRLEDLDFDDGLPVVMTEKDAVKCERQAGEEFWFLPIEAQLPAAFEQRLLSLLRREQNGQEAA